MTMFNNLLSKSICISFLKKWLVNTENIHTTLHTYFDIISTPLPFHSLYQGISAHYPQTFLKIYITYRSANRESVSFARNCQHDCSISFIGSKHVRISSSSTTIRSLYMSINNPLLAEQGTFVCHKLLRQRFVHK